MSSSPPPVVADRYRLVAPLGQGGMGRVWRATDVVLHREVAIKELVPPPGLTPSERQEMRERSLREARAIARLNNINVVRVFDVLSTDADPWIVMEYVPSRSLQDTLAQDGPFNPLRTAEIGLGVLNALRAAHRNGVVHRDVKPGNVLLGADGRVVLTDFGLATVPGDPNVTRTGLVLGSPAYIAPERARDGTAGPAADLWSLGATLYAAVEGQSPFARPSAIATLAALATENVPVARNGGPLKPVLNGLLRKDPAHRINAEEAERLLSRAAGRRAKITFPMSPSMRRPGVGRERPSLPSGPGGPPVLPGSGWVTATGSAPVVPNPRPPVAQPPAADGRPPHFAQGKAQVTPEPPRRPAKPLDATRLDTPPVRDEINPISGGTGNAPGQPPRPATGRSTVSRPPADRPAAGRPSIGMPSAGRPPMDSGQGRPPMGATPGRPPVEYGAGRPQVGAGPGRAPIDPASGRPPVDPATGRPPVDAGSGRPPLGANPGRVPVDSGSGRPPAEGSPQSVANSAVPTNALRTGFTAADVAANRRKQAAPEHERSLAQATSGYPVVTPRDASASDSSVQEAPAPEETKTTPEISRPGTKADSTTGAKAEPLAEPAGEANTAGTEANVGSRAEVATGAPADSTTEPKADSDAGHKTGPNAGHKTGPNAGLKVDSNAGDKVESNAGDKAGSEAGDKADHKTGAEIGDESGSEAGERTGSSAGDETGSKVGAEAGSEADSATGSPAVSASGSDSNSAELKAAAEKSAAENSAVEKAAAENAAAEKAVAGGAATEKAEAAEPVGAAESAEATTVPKQDEEKASTSADAPDSVEPTAADSLKPAGQAASTDAPEPVDQPASADAPKSVDPPKPAAPMETPKPATPEPARAEERTAPAPAANAEAEERTTLLGSPAKGEVEEHTTLLGASPKGEVEERTTLLGAPPKGEVEERTTLLGALPKGEVEERTTYLAPQPRSQTEDRTTLLSPGGADDDRTSVVSMPPRRRIVTSNPEPPTSVVGDVPGFNRPNRPAWTPMQLRPQERRGITIFGTTLTRRQAAIGLGIVLTFVLLVGIIVVQAFGDDDPVDPNVAKGDAGASAPAQAGAGQGQGQGGKPVQGGTGTPSAPPSSSPAPAGFTLPDGWRTYKASGFSLPVPESVNGSGGGTGMTLSWKKGRQFRVDIQQGKTDPVEYLRESDQGGANETSPKVVDYHGRAAEVEYDRYTGGGYKQHVVRRVFNEKGKTWVLTWYTEDSDWEAAKKDLEIVYQGFTVK